MVLRSAVNRGTVVGTVRVTDVIDRYVFRSRIPCGHPNQYGGFFIEGETPTNIAIPLANCTELSPR